MATGTPWAGVGGAPAASNYTWGGTTPRRLAYSSPGIDALPDGTKDYADATAQGYYKARDAADGQWLWTKAGEMKAYDTTGMAMTDTGFGRSIPTASANLPSASYIAGGPQTKVKDAIGTNPGGVAAPDGGPAFTIGPGPVATGALPAATTAAQITPPPGGVAPGATGALPTSLTGAATYAPNDSSLVAKQLQALLASDSPYVQRARTRAMEYANSRGGLNSSIAAGAGEGAAIDAAMPIAQADASAHLGSLRDNANALNQFGAAGNAFQFQGALNTQNAGITTARDAAQFGYQTQLNAQGAAINTARDSAQFANRLTEMRATTDEQIRLMDKQQGTNLYASYRTSSENIQNDYAAAIQAIQVSDMDADVKSAQIANLQNLTIARQNFLSTIYSNSPGWSADWAKFAVEVSGG